MTTEDAKAYLAKREIPSLFESLMTGLMFYRPEDHINYLQECLKKVQSDGLDKVRWNMFIESRKKTPLPPISPDNGRARTPIGKRDPSFITENPQPLDRAKGSPLPPIGTKLETNTADRIELPKCPIVLVMGGPGCGRATQARMLLERYSGWVHLSMGDLLRKTIFDKGSADQKWDMVGQLVQKGEMAPEELNLDLIKTTIGANMNATGIIIEGYPRTMEQLSEYMKYIGRVDLAFVLDCEEKNLQMRLTIRREKTERPDDNENAILARVATFKERTLPVIKHLDDMGKLVIVDGDRDTQEIFYDLCVLFDNILYGGQPIPQTGNSISSAPPTAAAAGGAPAQAVPAPRPPSSPRPKSGGRPGSGRYSRAGSRAGSRPNSGFTRVPTMLDIQIADKGRAAELPKCPIVFVMGGPGSGRGDFTKKAAGKYPGYVHISVGELLRKNAAEKSSDSKWSKVKELMLGGEMAPEDSVMEVVKDALCAAKDAKAVMIDGFPRNKAQLEEFNKNIGGLSLGLLLDCDEKHMKQNLLNRAATSGRDDDKEEAVDKRIRYYKHNTLPVLAHIDDLQKLAIINSDRGSTEVFADICEALEKAIGGDSADAAAGGIPADVPLRLEVNVADEGRKSGMPACPFISVVGSPGSGISDITAKVAKAVGYEYVKGAPNYDSLKSAKGVFMENYPSNKDELEDFNKNVGGMGGVIVLDCTEEHACKQASSDEIKAYQKSTLPVLGYYDDNSRLKVVNVEEQSEDQITQDITAAAKSIEEKWQSGSSGMAASTSLSPLEVNNPDAGRKDGLPDGKVVAVIGAPGSGIDAVCKNIAAKIEGSTVISATGLSIDELSQKISAEKDAKAYVLEGFPTSKDQLESFNEKVGGMSGVVVVDVSEEYANKNSSDKAGVEAFKSNTLPILGFYEFAQQRLAVVQGEKSADDVTTDVVNALQTFLQKSSA